MGSSPRPGDRFLDTLLDTARARLPEPVFRYYVQGSRDGVSAIEAVAAWDRFRFLPRVLRDVTTVDTTTSLLGTPLATPYAVAPTTQQRAAHPEGEIAMAAAVAAAGSLMVVSSNAGSRFEDIAATGVPWWLQVYVTTERARCLFLLEHAVAAGARAVVLTADTPVVGTKYDEGETIWEATDPGLLRVNFEADPNELGDAGAAKATDLSVDDIDWLATTTGLPVVVKGVLRSDEARRCVRAGASAVWVSNHGGRQLDYAAATAHCLEDVAAAVGDTAEVYVDGGIRCGRHALAALALGARAAFLGRLPLYALAADGRDGVAVMFEALDEQLVEAMRLAGCPSTGSVPRDLLM
ncbi:MAG TPA: alpha-hydroxy acid oxidase [Nocardioidaceae bacterium]|nr:alpha-hydroxy acid oxidase [Nocardioidaceae bacterium]